jgi:hypothetical protein
MSIKGIIGGMNAGVAQQQQYVDRQEFANQWNNLADNYKTNKEFDTKRNTAEQFRMQLDEAANDADPTTSRQAKLARSAINSLTGEIDDNYLKVMNFGAKDHSGDLMDKILMMQLGQGFQSAMQNERFGHEDAKAEQNYIREVQADPKKRTQAGMVLAPDLMNKLATLSEQYNKTKDPRILAQAKAVRAQIDKVTSSPKTLGAYARGVPLNQPVDTTGFGIRNEPVNTPDDFRSMSIIPDPYTTPMDEPTGQWPY